MNKIYYNESTYEQLGNLVFASCEDKLVYIGINKSKLVEFAAKLRIETRRDINSNKLVMNQVKEYLDGGRKVFSLETDLLFGTDFERKVWNELTKIPYGKTISYKELANRVNNIGAARAIGNANSKNPIPIVIPCHRVINSDGNLGGFSCGIGVKRYLLNLESVNISK